MTMPQDVVDIMSMFGDPLYQADIFYSYAKQATTGCIVELGTYRGRGAVALALGTRDGSGLRVYTIDDYCERKGWIGEPYGVEDKIKFLENVKAAGLEDSITLLQIDVLEASLQELWEEGIGLLLWDTGVSGRIKIDFDAWAKYIIPDGVFLMKDAQEYCLGSDEVIEDAVESGKWLASNHMGLITALRKLS